MPTAFRITTCITVGLTAGLAIAGCAGAPAAGPIDTPPTTGSAQSALSTRGASYGADAENIEAHVGERFTLMLEENMSTPIRWGVEVDGDAVALGGSEHSAEPPADCPRCVGYPGTRVFEFEARQAGDATLRLVDFHVARPEQQSPRASISVHVSTP